MRGRVVVIGGGVGGMSAAHELVERGFEVVVLEDRKVPGGKARSVDVRPAPGVGVLPGEHGFRFFAGFYRHLPDTMRRIPYGSNRDGVAGNLVECPHFEFARATAPPVVLPTHPPRSIQDVALMLQATFGADWGVPPDELAYFASRLAVLLTSCEERRYRDWEYVGWEDFVGADQRSPAYREFLADGLTRSFVAAKADLMSSRTGGYIFLQLLFDMGHIIGNADRILNGPTNERWIDPWRKYLEDRGVTYETRSRVEDIRCEAGRVTGVMVRTGRGKAPREVTGDWYVAAVPVERMIDLASDSLCSEDPGLADLGQLATRWMNGVQFYLKHDASIVRGHTVYMDSPWALTSISQAQFWPDIDLRARSNGTVSGILSVDVSDWETPGLSGKTAMACSRDEIIMEVWDQLKMHLNRAGSKTLADSELVCAFVDSDIRWRHPHRAVNPHREVNLEPLLINTVGSWQHRPEARTAIENLFLASDYVRTYTDLACMEAANEAARRAVNGILEASGSATARCRLWRLHEPAIFAPLRTADQLRLKLGLAHAALGPGEPPSPRY